MLKGFAESSPRLKARIAGIVYLVYFLTAIFAQLSASRPVISEALNLIAHAFYIALTLLFYYMFRPVNRGLSLLAAFFSLAGCANDLLGLLNRAPYNINSLVFFGPYCILIGYLIIRSTFLPRILGVLMVFAGLGWLIFLSPRAKHLTTYLEVLGILAEASLMLWLLLKGVNVERWKEQAGAAAASIDT